MAELVGQRRVGARVAEGSQVALNLVHVLAHLRALVAQHHTQAVGHVVELLGIAAGIVDRVCAGKVKPKERLVKSIKLLVKARPEVLLAQPARKHGLLPAKSRELLNQRIKLFHKPLLADELHERAALELALMGARNGQQAVLAQLARLNEVVDRLGEDVYAAQARGGVKQVAQDLVGTLRLLFGLPRREERDKRAEPAHGHAEVAKGTGVVWVAEEALGAGGKLAGRCGDFALDGDKRPPHAGLGTIDKPQEGCGCRHGPGLLPRRFGRGLGQLECKRGPLAQPDFTAKQMGGKYVKRGHVADDDHGLLGRGGNLGENGVHVLVVEGLVDLDAVDAQDVCDHLSRLHCPHSRARPHVDVVIVLEQRERSRKRNLERVPSVGRELAVKVRRVIPRLLSLAMSYENKGSDHETTSANATLTPT